MHLAVEVVYATYIYRYMQVQDTDGVYAALLISPSMTPYGRMNPSFRVHLLDRSNGYRLMDYEQYHLDLMKANGWRKFCTCIIMYLTSAHIWHVRLANCCMSFSPIPSFSPLITSRPASMHVSSTAMACPVVS